VIRAVISFVVLAIERRWFGAREKIRSPVPASITTYDGALSDGGVADAGEGDAKATATAARSSAARRLTT
jgi:hypothetical protein